MDRGKTCPECGTKGHEQWYYDKLVSEGIERGQMIRRISAQAAVDRANWDMDRLDLVEQMKWMQRKVKKQAQAITRLEEKLKKLKIQPYAEEE